jgi:putative intracellular protease/amidase
MKKILMPLPAHDFDPTEAAVTWRVIRAAGHHVVFATPDGSRAYADPLMLSGEGLDLWGAVPGLKKVKLIGLLLRADTFGRSAYCELERDPQFLNPLTYKQVIAQDYDALVLPGGHAKGMRPYLESKILQALIVEFFEQKNRLLEHRPVGAICHGVLLAARAISGSTHRSVLYGRKTTALTWDFEKSATTVCSLIGRVWEPYYYRTYDESAGEPKGYWSVEAETKRFLEKPEDFFDVPLGSPNFKKKTSGLVRDRLNDPSPAWVVRDGQYLSARWPGDVHTFAQQFVGMLEDQKDLTY